MKKAYYFALFVIFSVFILGCNKTTVDASEVKETLTEKVITSADNVEPGSLVHDVPKDTPVVEELGYKGKVLAGTETTKYLDFNKADYDKALKEKKNIALFLCKLVPDMQA